MLALSGAMLTPFATAQEVPDMAPFMALMKKHSDAQKAGTLTPVDDFKDQTDIAEMNCELAAQTSLLKYQTGDADPPKDARDCAQEAKASVKGKFAPAVASLKKNAKAVDALKSYYVAWMTQLDGMVPDQGDSKLTYRQRQSESRQHTQEAWSRFIIEAGPAR